MTQQCHYTPKASWSRSKTAAVDSRLRSKPPGLEARSSNQRSNVDRFVIRACGLAQMRPRGHGAAGKRWPPRFNHSPGGTINTTGSNMQGYQ